MATLRPGYDLLNTFAVLVLTKGNETVKPRFEYFELDSETLKQSKTEADAKKTELALSRLTYAGYEKPVPQQKFVYWIKFSDDGTNALEVMCTELIPEDVVGFFAGPFENIESLQHKLHQIEDRDKV